MKYFSIYTFKNVPEKRGRVSSGYMLASWMESWDRLTLYRGGRGPCVPYKILPGFCSTIRLEYAHSLDSSTCRHIIDFFFYSHSALSGFGFMLLFSFPTLCLQIINLKKRIVLFCVPYVPASAAWRSHIFPCWCLRPWTAPDWARSQGHMGNSWQSKEGWLVSSWLQWMNDFLNIA